MVYLDWLSDNWFTFLQSAGIIGSLMFTAIAIVNNTKERRISNLFILTKHHHDIWTAVYRRPDLGRVLESNPDLDSTPVTNEEEIFVGQLVLHLSSAHAAMRQGMFNTPGGIQADIQEFFSYPIPFVIWNKLKPLQDLDFVAFVDRALQQTPTSNKE